MFAVLSEVRPKPAAWDDYLRLAAEMRPHLLAMPGFIDNERFRRLGGDGGLLSLSTWGDEKALVRWRSHGGHAGVQRRGRFEVFEDYRLRVGAVVADDAPPAGHAVSAPRADVTEAGTAKAATVTEAVPLAGATLDAGDLAGRLGLGHADAFESITAAGKLLFLAAWPDDAAAAAHGLPAPPPGVAALRHRRVQVIRDYGMHDRREAPQYLPDVPAQSSNDSASNAP